MISTHKQEPIMEQDYNGGSFNAPFIKEDHSKFEQWKHRQKSFKDTLFGLLHIPQEIEGVSFWRINRKLNRLADKGIPGNVLRDGKIIISLPAKQSLEWVHPSQKKLIEKTIDELEGFENLRLSQFYSYKPSYIEKKTYNKIARWIEIEITDI